MSYIADMTLEMRDIGEVPSILDRIQTRIGTIKLKENRLEAEKRQAAEEVRSMLSHIVAGFPEAKSIVDVSVQIESGGRTISKTMYDPENGGLFIRAFGIVNPNNYQDVDISEVPDHWISYGTQIAEELTGRVADIARVK